MSFLDELADCESCPVPHNICEWSGCAMCGPCPAARERRETSAAQAHHRMTRPLAQALREMVLPVRAPAVAE